MHVRPALLVPNCCTRKATISAEPRSCGVALTTIDITPKVTRALIVVLVTV
jgi:hypothetical protein